MNTKPLVQFRSQLFEAIEERRSKLDLFSIPQLYFFINRCSKLFASPGTKEAQEALNKIQNEGTFLLVADSLRDFRAMFPDSELREDVDRDRAREADADRDAGRPTPGPHHGMAQQPAPRPSRPSQPTPDARHSSGQPFCR